MSRAFVLFGAVYLLGACGGYGLPDSKVVPDHPTFDNSVKTVMDKHCNLCHGAKPYRGASSEFRLDVYACDGKHLAAGDMAQQILDSAGGEMPPSGSLGPNDMKILSKWVAAGAPESETTGTSALKNEPVSCASLQRQGGDGGG